jgi:hypothetical protein
LALRNIAKRAAFQAYGIGARIGCRFTLTESNADGIQPIAGTRAGPNPLHDAAQRTFERKDTGRAPSYRETVRAFASSVSEKHIRQAKMQCAHLRNEFVCEVESAVGEFIGARMHRFPKLAADLLARFACGALPASTSRALHRAARRACDARMRRMSGTTALVSPSFFAVFASEPDQSAELNAVLVNARVDALLATVRERASKSGNAARAARTHAQLLEAAREYFIASIAGTATELPSSGIVRESAPVGFNVCQTFRGKRLIASRREVVRETRGERLGSRALYHRMRRLADFTRDAELQDALARVGAIAQQRAAR